MTDESAPPVPDEPAEPADGNPLDRLVTEFLDRLDAGEGGALGALCAAHPELAEGLRRRVRTLHRLDLIPVREELRLPERLGEYELLERLGAGAMSVVHRGRSERTAEQVALKIVRPELVLFGDARERFEREVRLAARLDHPGLSRVLAIGESDGLPWFATVLVSGGTLAQWIGLARAEYREARRITPEAVAELARRLPLAAGRGPAAGPSWRERMLDVGIEVADALQHAHANGVLHRDVKPSNVLLHADGRAVLGDLGLAAEPTESSISRSGSMIGSLPYLAPEVVDGVRGDVRADVYALGVTLYEALTLQRPFTGATSSQLMSAILQGQAPRPSSLGADVDADLEAVLAKAMAREPRKRYATMAALAEDLAAAREGRATVARPLGAWARASRWVRRRPAAAAAAVSASLLLALLPLTYAAVQAAERRATERSADDLRAALERAEAERERADRSLEQAARAVEVLLEETADVLLDDVPFMERLEAVLLERALDVLAELDPRAPERPAERTRSARLSLSAASALANLGELARAREALAAGLAEVERLADSPEREELGFRLELLAAELAQRDDPEDAAARLESLLARGDAVPVELALEVEHLAAQVAGRRGRLGEALVLLDGAIERALGALTAMPRSANLERRLARLHGTRGEMSLLLGRNAEAAEDLERALGILDRLQRDDPEHLRLRSDRISARVNLAVPLEALGRTGEAFAALEAARVDAAELTALFPGSQELAGRYVDVCVNLGYLASVTGDDERAVALFEEAIARALEWVAADRASLGLARGALQASQNLAGTAHAAGRFEEAIERVAAAAPLQAWVAQRAPDDPLLGRVGISLRVIQCLSALELERPELADEALEGAEAAAPPLPDSLRLLVEALLIRSEALPEGERRSELQARALRVLQRAVEHGYANGEDLALHPRLEPLRESPDFPAAGAVEPPSGG